MQQITINLNYTDEIVVLCGDTSPLWICCNAMDENHKCVYAICNSCKYVLDEHQGQISTRRTSRSRIKNVDEDDKRCNHKLDRLRPFVDKTYFDETYMSKKIEDGCYIPVSCKECYGKITGSFKTNTSEYKEFEI